MSSTIRNFVFGCVSDKSIETGKLISNPPLDLATNHNSSVQLPTNNKVKFGVILSEAIPNGKIPAPLKNILVHIARDGVTTADLFRRPGNPTDAKTIIKKLSEGKELDLDAFNFYTLASIIKKFLLKIPGGIFGADIERELLKILQFNEKIYQLDSLRRILLSLPLGTQRLLSLLFGCWFRMVDHSDINLMTTESVAKSVAGSMFHTCSDDPNRVDLAVAVIRLLIENYASEAVFGSTNIEYFTRTTGTTIDVRERYKYVIRWPAETRQPFDQDYMVLFEKVVQYDSKCRGIDPKLHAITAEEFLRPRRVERPSSFRNGAHAFLKNSDNNTTSNCLLPPSQFCNGGASEGEHRKLTYMASSSAPDINQVCQSFDIPESSSTQFDFSKSLNRVDSVYRKQMLRLRKRSDWFLAPSPETSCSPIPFRAIVCRSVSPLIYDTGASSSSIFNHSSDQNGRLRPSPMSLAPTPEPNDRAFNHANTLEKLPQNCDQNVLNLVVENNRTDSPFLSDQEAGKEGAMYFQINRVYEGRNTASLRPKVVRILQEETEFEGNELLSCEMDNHMCSDFRVRETQSS